MSEVKSDRRSTGGLLSVVAQAGTALDRQDGEEVEPEGKAHD